MLSSSCIYDCQAQLEEDKRCVPVTIEAVFVKNILLREAIVRIERDGPRITCAGSMSIGKEKEDKHFRKREKKNKPIL